MKEQQLSFDWSKMETGFVVWLTGLSGSGKSTLAGLLVPRLVLQGHKVEILDGDHVRESLSKGLGFSKEDRDENIKRIGFVANLLARNGVVVIVAAISPYREARDKVRAMVPGFVEVYCACSLDTLEQRDVKGLYRRARAGEISSFTGVSDDYEPPFNPEVTIHSDKENPIVSLNQIWRKLVLLQRGLL